MSKVAPLVGTKASLMALIARGSPTAVVAKGAKGVDVVGDQPPAEDQPPAPAAAPPAGGAPTDVSQKPPPPPPPPEPAPALAASTLDELERRKKLLDATIKRLRRQKYSPGEVEFTARAKMTPTQQALVDAEEEQSAGDASDALTEARAERIEVLKEMSARSGEADVSEVAGTPADVESTPMFRERGRLEHLRRLREWETGQREIPRLAPTTAGRLMRATNFEEATYTDPTTGEEFVGSAPVTAGDVAGLGARTAALPFRAASWPIRTAWKSPLGWVPRTGLSAAKTAILGEEPPPHEGRYVDPEYHSGYVGDDIRKPRRLESTSQAERDMALLVTGGRMTTAKGEGREVRDVPEAEKRSAFHGLPLNERVQLAGDLRNGAMQTLNDIDAAIRQMDEEGQWHRAATAQYRKLKSQRTLIQEQLDLMWVVVDQLKRVQIAEANKQRVPVEG